MWRAACAEQHLCAPQSVQEADTAFPAFNDANELIENPSLVAPKFELCLTFGAGPELSSSWFASGSGSGSRASQSTTIAADLSEVNGDLPQSQRSEFAKAQLDMMMRTAAVEWRARPLPSPWRDFPAELENTYLVWMRDSFVSGVMVIVLVLFLGKWWVNGGGTSYPYFYFSGLSRA